MKKALIISILALSFLQGCAFDNPFIRKDVIITDRVVNIDPKALQPCQKLAPLASQFSNDPFGDILDNVQDIVQKYNDCATKQDNSIILLKQFSNKESK